MKLDYVIAVGVYFCQESGCRLENVTGGITKYESTLIPSGRGCTWGLMHTQDAWENPDVASPTYLPACWRKTIDLLIAFEAKLCCHVTETTADSRTITPPGRNVPPHEWKERHAKLRLEMWYFDWSNGGWRATGWLIGWNSASGPPMETLYFGIQRDKYFRGILNFYK